MTFHDTDFATVKFHRLMRNCLIQKAVYSTRKPEIARAITNC